MSSTTAEVAPRRDRLGASADRLLSLAAAPTFAAMAALTGLHDGGMPAPLCSAAHNASTLTGMAAMYVLMAAFHVAPWLRFLSHRRSQSGSRRASNALGFADANPRSRC